MRGRSPLIGAPREVFERSAFVGQGGAAIDGAPALETRISALASCGEEDVSYSQVERRLRDWLNRPQAQQDRPDPRLEEQISTLSADLARQSKAHRTAQEALLSLDGLRRERDTLEAELAVHRARRGPKARRLGTGPGGTPGRRSGGTRYQTELYKDGVPPDREVLRRAQEELNLLRGVEQKLKQAERDYEAAIQAASDAREAAADPLFAGMSPDEAWDKANLDADKAELDPPASAGSLTAGALLLLAGAGAGAAGILLHPMAFLAAGVFLVGGGLLLLRGIRLRQRAPPFWPGENFSPGTMWTIPGTSSPSPGNTAPAGAPLRRPNRPAWQLDGPDRPDERAGPPAPAGLSPGPGLCPHRPGHLHSLGRHLQGPLPPGKLERRPSGGRGPKSWSIVSPSPRRSPPPIPT